MLRREAAACREFARRLGAAQRMLNVLNRRLGTVLDPHDLEDLAQDVIAVVLEKLPGYRAAGRFEGWLYRICVYQILNAWRRTRSKRQAEADADFELVASADGGAWDVLAYDLVQEKLTQLGPPGEEVIRLRDLEGKSFAEIAALQGVPINTVKARYYRGLEALRVLLGVERS